MARADDSRLDAHAPPFSRNPSAWSQRIPICVLAAVGAIISTYLALFQWGLIETVWDPVFGDGTRTVLESDASGTMHRWIGVPDAALGALAYLGDAIFGLAGSTRRWQYRPWMVIIFGIDVIPLGIVSIVLVFVQGLVVGSWCFLCLITAAISTVLIPLAADEVWATLAYLRRVWKEHRDARLVWRVFWGQRDERADALALQAGA